jgi:flagellar assembly protein FliH
MSNILKTAEFSSQSRLHMEEVDLEDFPKPPDPIAALSRGMQAQVAQGSQEEEGAEEEIDLEALRLAVLEEARVEAEKKVQEAYAEGLRRGMEAGRAEFLESIAECESALHAAAGAMVRARKDFLDTLEPQVFEMALLLGERVLQREVRCDPEMVQHIAQKALTVLADRQHVVIRVHPSDLTAIREHEIALLDQFGGMDSLAVEEDASVGAGGCEVFSETMQVDARLETLLQHVLDELTG